MKANTLLLLTLLIPSPLFASVRISEVMYDVSGTDSGREWIEVVNQGTQPVDLSTYKLFEGGVNHKITAVLGSALLSPGAVAILADNPTKFQSDWPNVTSAIFDTSFSGGLSNVGEDIVLRTGELKAEDSISYTSASADGNGLSLSRGDSGSLVATKPTPGTYLATPSKVTIAPPQTVVTQAKRSQLQKGVAGKGTVAAVMEAQEPTPTHEEAVRVPTNFAQPKNMIPTPWLWGLGALGLAFLGLGAVYALRPWGESGAAQGATHAIAEEAAMYEIIE